MIVHNLEVGESRPDILELARLARLHVISEMRNLQCRMTLDEIRRGLARREIRMRCMDKRGLLPTFGGIGGSGPQILLLINVFVETLRLDQRFKALRLLKASYGELYGRYHALVRPYTHEDCAYLKELEVRSREYGVLDPEFVKKFKGTRKGDHHHEILQGKESGKAVLLVQLPENGQGRLPRITPNGYFVIHPQVGKILHSITALKMLSEFQSRTGFSVSKTEYLNHLGRVIKRHIDLTLPRIAEGLPIFEITVCENESVQVRVLNSCL